jgi:hypothetical protein
MDAVAIILVILVIFLVIVLFASIKVVQEYERGVVFRLGRLAGVRGPGLILLIPFLERMQKVDLRTVTMDIPAQEVITKDNVTIRVNAVAYFRVLNPDAAIVNVADYIRATSQIAQTTLRSVLGQSSMDDLLAEREMINQQLAKIIDDQTEPWGIKVSIVGNGAPGRGRTREAGQDHPRRGRIPGQPAVGGSGRDHQPESGHDPVALSPDADRDRRRAEHHRRLPAADRHVEQPDGIRRRQRWFIQWARRRHDAAKAPGRAARATQGDPAPGPQGGSAAPPPARRR